MNDDGWPVCAVLCRALESLERTMVRLLALLLLACVASTARAGGADPITASAIEYHLNSAASPTAFNPAIGGATGAFIKLGFTSSVALVRAVCPPVRPSFRPSVQLSVGVGRWAGVWGCEVGQVGISGRRSGDAAADRFLVLAVWTASAPLTVHATFRDPQVCAVCKRHVWPPLSVSV